MDDRYRKDAESLKYWLALVRIPSLGSIRIHRLLDQFGTPKEIFAALSTSTDLLGLPHPITPLFRDPPWHEIDRDLRWLEQPNHQLVSWEDVRFPGLLRHIPNPPVVLFVQGNPDLLRAPQLAIVGSRNPTASGRTTAKQFAQFLAASGLTITSGMAIGVDGAAHEGALDELGSTIAVTATGLDRLYPNCHRELAQRIAEKGALISEFPLGTPVRRGHFPRRNRIISGLALGTLVVEAARDSGSLITAREAVNQGREVFAIPGSIHNPLTRGCHDLIRQGAKLVETVQDILEEIAPMLGKPDPPATARPAIPIPTDLDSNCRRLLAALEFDPLPNDILIQRSGLTAAEVSSMLLLLELQGYVSSVPGRGYCLNLDNRPDAVNQPDNSGPDAFTSR